MQSLKIMGMVILKNIPYIGLRKKIKTVAIKIREYFLYKLF